MASRIRNPFRGAPRHRRDRAAHTAEYLEGEAGFTPRHCAGDTCFHDHPSESAHGLSPWRNFHEVSA